jgi:G3E family GTPase
MADENDRRSLVGLLVEQIEFADVILLNKVSSASELETVRKLVRSLNPDARIIEADQSRVPLSEVLETGRFDPDRAEEHPLWAKELYGFADHTPEAQEYGIESFVYRARRPFDPVKFRRFLNRSWPGVVRAKGHFWIATRPDWVGEMSQAGAQVTSQGLGRWWAAVPKDRWPDGDAFERLVRAKWDAQWGDRRQELVFIGIDMDRSWIEQQLDRCLVPQRRFQPELWRTMPDPFPTWGGAAASA